MHDGALAWSESGDAPVGDGWRALVESRRASSLLSDPARLPAFAAERGDVSIDDDGLAQKLEGDSCPCEGGGQIRELGRPGHLRRDEQWPDDDCKRGSGVGVHGYSYLVIECSADAPSPELMARGPDGREHLVRRVRNACEDDRPTFIATDGKRVFGVVGRELLRIEDTRATPIGRAPTGVIAMAVGRKGIFVVRGNRLWRFGSDGWTPVELVEDGC